MEFDFHIELLGNVYCSLSLSRKVECPYLSDIKDHNGLYSCMNLLYNKLYDEPPQ